MLVTAVVTTISIFNLEIRRTIRLGVDDIADQKILWVSAIICRGWPASHFVRNLPNHNLTNLTAEIAAVGRHDIRALELMVNFVVAAILVGVALAIPVQLQRAYAAVGITNPSRRPYPRLGSKLLLAIVILAIFVAQNSAIESSGPYRTRISRKVDVDLHHLESGWPIGHWRAFGVLVSGRTYVTELPDIPRYLWPAMALNFTCCALTILVANKALSLIVRRRIRSSTDEVK